MSEQPSPKIAFKQAVPLVSVKDVGEAVKFYPKKMGFEIEYVEEDCFAMIDRDGVTLHLIVCSCDDSRHTGQSFFQVNVDNIEDLFQEYQAAGVEFVWELTLQAWGQKNFKVTDPDGNWMMFAGPFLDNEED